MSPCSECAALLLNLSADFTLLLPPTLPIRHLVLTGTVNGFIKAPNCLLHVMMRTAKVNQTSKGIWLIYG